MCISDRIVDIDSEYIIELNVNVVALACFEFRLVTLCLCVFVGSFYVLPLIVIAILMFQYCVFVFLLCLTAYVANIDNVPVIYVLYGAPPAYFQVVGSHELYIFSFSLRLMLS